MERHVHGKDEGSKLGSMVQMQCSFSRLSLCKSTCDCKSFPISLSREGAHAHLEDVLEVD